MLAISSSEMSDGYIKQTVVINYDQEGAFKSKLQLPQNVVSLFFKNATAITSVTILEQCYEAIHTSEHIHISYIVLQSFLFECS